MLCIYAASLSDLEAVEKLPGICMPEVAQHYLLGALLCMHLTIA